MSVKNNKYSLRLNGNGYVDLGNPQHLQLIGNLTIEMWLKVDDWRRYQIFHKNSFGECAVFMETNGVLRFQHGDGSSSYSFSCRTPVNQKEWTHVAVVRDAYNKRIRWYINGIFQIQHNFTNFIANTSDNFLIGSGEQAQLRGNIDEFRIWNVVRTDKEISDYMYRTLRGREEGLVCYLKFDEGSGNIVYDSSLYENNGILYTGSWEPAEIPLNGNIDININEQNVIVERGKKLDYSFSIVNKPSPIKITKNTELIGNYHIVSVNKRDWLSINKIRIRV